MKVFFLRVADKAMINRVENQFKRNRVFIYNTSIDYDKERVLETFQGIVDGFVDIAILVINYDKVANEKIIEKIWVGKCKQVQKHPYKLVIRHEKLLSIKEQSFSLLEDLYTVCQNSDIRELIDEKPGYLFVKKFPMGQFYESIYIIPKIQRSYMNPPYKGNTLEHYEYCVEKNCIVEKKVGEKLHPLAQKNYDAIRPCALGISSLDRGEFSRDRDRIIHSKAFRRLVDKAQIYTSSKGDHFRTRLTHTLEVNQIARAISRALGLNEDLTEAIALGHDLGHTPFGHEGEREIDQILAGKIKLSEFHCPENYGGFKHNFQSVRIANYLEEKYNEHEGLNLSYQVIEGMLKHTKIKKCKLPVRKCNGCADKCYDINEFLMIGDCKYLHLEQDYPSTLEGQVVNWADEIAQRGHDLDDGMRSGVLSRDDLLDLRQHLSTSKVVPGSSDEKLIADTNTIISNVIQHSYQSNERLYIDVSDLARSQIVSKVISFFITRLIEQSKMNMKTFWKNNIQFENNPVITEKIIRFEESDEELLEKIGDVITNKVINSYEVNCFDGKAAYMIRRLFKAFYANPRQLPDNVINRINKELTLLGCDVIDIRKGKKDAVIREIEIFKGQGSSYRLDEIKVQKQIWDDICEDYIKRKIFMRCIADHISGMTDEYANTTFKQLYIP